MPLSPSNFPLKSMVPASRLSEKLPALSRGRSLNSLSEKLLPLEELLSSSFRNWIFILSPLIVANQLPSVLSSLSVCGCALGFTLEEVFWAFTMGSLNRHTKSTITGKMKKYFQMVCTFDFFAFIMSNRFLRSD